MATTDIHQRAGAKIFGKVVDLGKLLSNNGHLTVKIYSFTHYAEFFVLKCRVCVKRLFWEK